MKAQEYAQAIYIATQGKSEADTERILQNVSRIIKEKGHTKLLVSIERELEKILQRTEGSGELLIRVSKESDAETFISDIEKDALVLQAEALPRKVVVDSTLVGGYELRANGTRIDRTYKRSLLTLYNNLVTN